MNETMTMSITRAGGPAVAPERVDVRVLEDEFQEPCEICFVRPTAVLVELRGTGLDAAAKTGSDARDEVVERRYFCAEHICAADMVYRFY